MPGASDISTEQARTAARAGIPQAPRPVGLALVGPDGVGKRSLLAAAPAGLAAAVSVHTSLASNTPADALLLACEATADAEAQAVAFEALVVQLRTHMGERGRRCQVAGLPVFVVLTKADVLARPGDFDVAWLDRIKEQKQHISEKLAALLPESATGFGGINLHVWATAARRPRFAESPTQPVEPVGIQELFQQAVHEAKRYVAHLALQKRRMRAIFGLLVLLLLVMASVAGRWVFQHRELLDPEREQLRTAGQEQLDRGVQARKLLAAGHDLLHFDAHSTPLGGVDWPRWLADADNLSTALLHVSVQLEKEEDMTTLVAKLQEAAKRLAHLQARAVLLGFGPEGARAESASLRGPAADCKAAQVEELATQTLKAIQEQHPGFAVYPLPDGMPLGAVRELQHAAESSLDRYLEPIRADVQARVLRLGDGKETLAAWRSLRDTWLNPKTKAETAAWREVTRLLQLLVGQPEARDPLEELEEYLRQEQFSVRLARVDLRLPEVVRQNGLQITGLHAAGGPLEWRIRSGGVEKTLLLEPLPRTLPVGTVFGTGGTLVLRPGDEVAIRLSVKDAQGRSWWLTWTSADSRTRVYAFEVLTQAPRLHTPEQTDPSQGLIAFGAALDFDGARALRLPLLFPR